MRPSNAHDTDLVRIYIKHSELKVPITITPRQWSQMDSTAILDKLEYVLSNKDTLRVDESLEIHVGTISVPIGSGGALPIRKVAGNLTCLERKSSIIRIRNTDHICFSRAVIVAKAKADNDPLFKRIANHRCCIQGYKARDLQRAAGLPIDQPISLNDVHRIEQICQRQIVIFSSTEKCKQKPLYVGQHKEKKLYIYHRIADDGVSAHYDAITSVTF